MYTVVQFETFLSAKLRQVTLISNLSANTTQKLLITLTPMDSFGASDAAQHAAAVINGDVPDTDLFGDKESDDEDAFGQSSTRFRGDAEVDDPFGVAPPISVSAAGESDAFAEPLGVAEVAKKARTRRPKLDANVLCGEQHGLGALYARSKELTREEKTLSEKRSHRPHCSLYALLHGLPYSFISKLIEQKTRE